MTTKKSIPPSVIKQLNRDLAALVPAFTPEAPLIRGGSTVQIAKKHAPMHSHPGKTKRIATLPKGSKFQLVGLHDDYLGVLHNEDTGWLHRDDVQITPTLFSRAAGAKSSGWLQEKWEQMRQELVKGAIEIRNKYQDNPYISIKGFSVVISVPPALSIDFEFKSPAA